MIQKITISNYYSIREPLEVSFEASKEKMYGEDWIVQKGNVKLLKGLLLYGANGSGKSNILGALDFLRSLLVYVPKDVDAKLPYIQFALDPHSSEKDTEFTLYFFIGETRYYYHVTLNPQRILSEELRIYHNGNNSRAIYTRTYKPERGINDVRFGTWLNLSQKDRQTLVNSTTANVTVLSVFATKNIACEELKVVRNYFKNEFFRVYCIQDSEPEVAKDIKESPELKILLVEMLKSFHSNIVDIKVEEEVLPVPEQARQLILQMDLTEEEKANLMKMSTIANLKGQYIHKTELGKFSLEDRLQSEGTRTFINYLVLFYKAIQNNWLVALDEFGEGMQAKSQNLLLNFFLKFSQGAQLILATQSLGLLDNEMMRRDAIHIVYKDELGQTHIDAKTVRSIHRTTKLRKAYIEGKFTTIDPNEPDIDLDNEYAKYQSLIFGQTGKEVLVK